MRLWTFVAGLYFAGFVLVATSPLVVGGVAAAWWLGRSDLFSALDGQSAFGLRERGGRVEGRLVNVGFHVVNVQVPGQPRPRRLVVRLDVTNPDIFQDGRTEGLIRLDAWAMDSPADLKAGPLYTVVAAGLTASLRDDETLAVSHGNRLSAYSLSTGAWLYDSDTPVTVVGTSPEGARTVAVAAAEDGLPASAVAVVTLATNRGALMKVLVMAADETRARLLRSSVPQIHPVLRRDNGQPVVVELPLSAESIRLPVDGDRFDIAKAQLPPGLGLVELKTWKSSSL